MNDSPMSERIITPMPKALLEAVEDYRFSNRIGSRSEAIRRLLDQALEVERQKAGESEARS